MSRMPAVARAAQRETRLEAIARLARERWNRFVRDDVRFALVAAAFGFVVVAVAVVAARVFGRDFPTFLFVCSVLVAAIGLVRPYVAVLGAILVSPTFAWAVFGPEVSAFQVLVAGAALGCLRELRSDRDLARRLTARTEVVVAVLFATWLAFAALIRRETSDWGFVRNYVGAVIFLAVIVLTLRTLRQRATAVGALLVGAVATALVGLAQIFTTEALVSAWVLPDVDLIRETYTRLASAWGLANVGSDYGKDVIVGFLIAVPMAVDGIPRRIRIPVVLAAAGLCLGLIMSGGRSAWLGAVLGLFYIMVAVRRWARILLLSALAASLILLVTRPSTPVDIQAALGLPRQDVRGGAIEPARPETSSTPSRPVLVAGVRDALSVERSSNLRKRLTVAALEMIRDEPLVGVGAGAFKQYVDRYEPLPKVEERPLDTRPNLPAHNVVAELWADSGTPAAILYLTLLALVFLRVERHRRGRVGFSSTLALALNAALIGLFVTSLFHNYTYDNLLWAICGIGVSLGTSVSRPSAAERLL
jgi:O-antigen ligase/polysaccharide polymerase Wzy-like membrane protein